MHQNEDLVEVQHFLPTPQPKRIENMFFPLNPLSVWQEPSKTVRRITVAIVLSSGVHAGYFTVRVVDDGDVLQQSVDSPRPLIDISFIHKKWLALYDSTFTEFHPKFLGFEATLRNLTKNLTYKLVSVARIGLLFSVQSHIDRKSNIGYIDDSTRLLYVDLKATEDKYAYVNEKSDFEYF